MNQTQYIIEKSGLQPYKEGDYLAFNSGGVECEVGEFLYGLTKMVKPTRILETGTHKGISASYFGLALKDNQKGIIDTVEFDQQHFYEAESLWSKLELKEYVYLFRSKVEEFTSGHTYDIVFLDTEPDIRFREFQRFFPQVTPGGFIIIHDLHPHLGLSNQTINGMEHWPFGDFRKYFGNHILDHEIQTFHIRTGRGITLFQKSGPDFGSTKYLQGLTPKTQF